MRLTSGGNVGIGTASPGTTLDVNGVVNSVTGYRVVDAATTGNYLRGNGTNFVSSAIQAGDLPGSFSGFANPTTSIGLTTVNGSLASAMRSDAAPALSQAIIPTWTGTHTFSNGTYSALFTGGNVGVGTTNPSAPLQVGSSPAFQVGTYTGDSTLSAVYLNGAFSTAGSYNLLSGAGRDLYINRPSGQSIHFRDNNGSDQAIILDNGNVGIGTTLPNLQLQVYKAMGSGMVSITTSGSGLGIDASKGNTFVITMNSSVTATLSNCPAGEWLVFDIIGDGTHTYTWNTTYFHGGDAITGTSGTHNRQMFYCDGMNSNTNAYSVSPLKSP
jgi:hypothetical protein